MTEVALIRDPADRVATSVPVGRALERLRAALGVRGVGLVERPTGDRDAVLSISGPVPRGPSGAEAFDIVSQAGPPVRTTATGGGVRGLVYAVLELADRVEHEAEWLRALRVEEPIAGRPANQVRSVTRLFCSEVEDLPWFRDDGFWRRYLAMLVSQRFNRFSLTLGLGYNFPRGVTDAYLYFPYPFLLAVPGYDVRVRQLPDEERERNLAALRFLSEEADALGLDVQLGLWTHAYEWIDSPDAHQTIEGLTTDTHAAYCRDAVQALLEACPNIDGLTFRVHGEGGVPEGSWDFWRTVFGGVAGSGRRVGLDLHAKGLDEPTLEAALATGLPVTVSPKFWAEHMGLPYHQAAIREHERVPRPDPSDRSEWHSYMRVSEGSRPFTRYGYGDFLREDRPYGMVYRIWAGTQRLLLWGDPAFAAAYGRAGSIAGSQGLEWCEPLTFKGREGTGLPGARTGYADPSLVTRDDWETYAYAYRLFGRLTYDPEAPADGWERALRTSFGEGAEAAGSALANASRILPLLTTAHHPSASNNYFWPEIYTDMPIVTTEGEEQRHPYWDTPSPRRFGTVDPLDPEVFSSIVAYVGDLVADTSDGRVTPVDVAAELERLATDAIAALANAEGSLGSTEGRRWAVDVRILSALGRFFAAKIRAGVAFEIHRRTGNAGSIREAARHGRFARDAWIEAIEHADVYVPDLTFGPQAWIRGHWRDRLAAIERDVDAIERLAEDAEPSGPPAIVPGPSAPLPAGLDLRHDPPVL
ncbi:MAG TPA: hypothetical protein VFM81_09370, partial [Actinomycetota bacterium]|nr:hypothetical protein [Actinomycetota bacterium]